MSRISRTSSWEIRSSSRSRPSRLYSPAHSPSAARVASSYSPVALAGVAAERGQPPLQIGDELRRRLQQRIVPHEHRLVPDAEDPHQLVDGIGMVVDAQVDVAVVAALVSPTLADDQQRRGLPAALVPARRVAGHERGQQPVAQVALGLGESRGPARPPRPRPARMLPCAANPSPVTPPAQSMHLEPVNVAARPDASTNPTWRSSRPSSAASSRSSAGCAPTPAPISSSPSGPNDVFAQDCVATAPTPARAHGHHGADARELRRDGDPPVAGRRGRRPRSRTSSFRHLRRTSWNAVW